MYRGQPCGTTPTVLIHPLNLMSAGGYSAVVGTTSKFVNEFGAHLLDDCPYLGLKHPITGVLYFYQQGHHLL
jgi:hypothetical protein